MKQKTTILSTILLFITIFCFAQKQTKKEIAKDTVISLPIKSFETEKYLRELEKQVAQLRIDYFKTLLTILNEADTTYTKRMIGEPEHHQRRIYVKLKK